MTLQEQRQRTADLENRMRAIIAMADGQGRESTAAEVEEFEACDQEYNALCADIDRRVRLEAMGAHLAAPANGANGNGAAAIAATSTAVARPAASSTAAVSPRAPVSTPAGHAAPGAPRNGRGGYRIQVEDRAAGTFGFRDFGEFAIAVRNASVGGRAIDPRLTNSAGPPDNVMTEGIPADGGYAVPPDFRPDIQSLIEAEDSLLSLTDQITTSSNAVTMPVDASAPWSSTGIQAYWENEAALKQNSKIPLDQLTVRLFKLYCLVPVSDELLEDAPALSVLLRKKAPEVMDFRISEAILYGSGVGEPQGIYTSPAALKSPRAVAGKISAVDVTNMWAKCYSACRRRAVWVCNQEIESMMLTMFQPITDASGAIVNGFPVYMPPGGLSQAPFGTLMGRPVISTEAAPDIGELGDIALLDLQSVLSVQKTTGIRQDISIHLWFDYDITCFRFVLRLGAAPFWHAPIPSRTGTYMRSPFVLLDGTAITIPTRSGDRLISPTERRRREATGETLPAVTVTPAAAGGQSAATYTQAAGVKESNDKIAKAEHDRAERERLERERRKSGD